MLVVICVGGRVCIVSMVSCSVGGYLIVLGGCVYSVVGFL